MTPEQLLGDLHSAGAQVTFDPSGLRIQAPKDVMTAERRAAIKEHRDALLALVIAEHDQSAMAALDDSLSSDGAEPEPLDVQSAPRRPMGLKPPLGRYHAGNLAAHFTREEIVAMRDRMEARASEPNASPVYAQLATDWAELLAAKDGQWSAPTTGRTETV